MLDLKMLQGQIAKFNLELETEDRLVRVGLKDKLESAKVYKKHKDLFSKKLLEELKAKIKAAKGEDLDIAERVYFYLAGSYISQQLAPKYDQLTTFYSKARVKFEGEQLAFYDIAPRLSKDPIYARREILDQLSLKVIKKTKVREFLNLKAEIKLLKTMGWSGYLEFAEASKKIDYTKFEKVIRKVEKSTNNIWNESMNKVSLELLGRPFKKVKACHLSYLRSISAFDSYYPKEKVVPTFEKFVREMDLSDLLACIKIDAATRPKKNPTAVCYWPNPPTEVHLVIKPIGGEQDYEAMFHEGGHTLHAAAENSVLPYAFKCLSRSNALTEAYAFILEDLVFESAWLSRYMNVRAHTGSKIKWQATFVNLMLLRRYLGKFLYEWEVFSKDKLASAPTIYAKRLEETTGFVYQKEKYLFDMDPYFYSADYLRAWIGAAQIKNYLEKKFAKEWFFSPKAGAFLRELWTDGVKLELEDVVKKLGYKSWDISYLNSLYQLLGHE